MRILVPVTLGLLLLGAPAFAAPDDMTVQFAYRGHGSVAGTLEGSCASHGAILAPGGAVSFSAKGVELTHAKTWVNRSSVRPGHPEEIALSTGLEFGRWAPQRTLPDGQYEILPGEEAIVEWRPWGHPESEAASLTADFWLANASWNPPDAGAEGSRHFIDTPRLAGPPTYFNGLDIHDGHYAPGTRGLRGEVGRLDLNGAGVLHLRDAILRTPVGDITLPPYQNPEANVTAPLDAARHATVRYEEIFLNVTRLTLHAAQAPVIVVCGATKAHVDGMLQLFQATGTVEDATLPDFDGQVLELSGSFTIQDGPVASTQGATIQGTAQGRIEFVGVDFVPYHTGIGTEDLVKAVGALVGLVLALALAQKTLPALTALFTRLSDRDVLGHPTRRRIVHALAEGPIVGESGLHLATGARRGTLRHHVGVLVAAGMIQRFDVAGQTIYLGAGSNPGDALHPMVEQDPRLQRIHDAFQRGMDRRTVVAHLVRETSVPERTARKQVATYLRVATALQTKDGRVPSYTTDQSHNQATEAKDAP